MEQLERQCVLATNSNSKDEYLFFKATTIFPFKKSFGEGSSAQNSSARKICSTPESQLLDTV
jgi:hypothetical protein